MRTEIPLGRILRALVEFSLFHIQENSMALLLEDDDPHPPGEGFDRYGGQGTAVPANALICADYAGGTGF
jgi:hypothetical protein